MQQGLCNDMVSGRLSHSPTATVCSGFAAVGPASRRYQAVGTPQQGNQQQMRVVSRRDARYEHQDQYRLIKLWVSTVASKVQGCDPQCAAGLLLRARRAGDINRQRRAPHSMASINEVFSILSNKMTTPES